MTFVLTPVADNTGTTAIGTPTTVVTTTIGENALAHVRGHRRSEADVARVGELVHRRRDLVVLQPDGLSVTSLFVDDPTGFRDVFTLPVTGTYTVVVDPRVQQTGTVTFVLTPVPTTPVRPRSGRRRRWRRRRSARTRSAPSPATAASG